MIDPGVLALVGTIFGGVGLKVVETILSKKKSKSDTAAEIRNELRTDVAALRKEMKDLEEQLDIWKEKYYDLLNQFYKKGLVPDDPPGPPPEFKNSNLPDDPDEDTPPKPRRRK